MFLYKGKATVVARGAGERRSHPGEAVMDDGNAAGVNEA